MPAVGAARKLAKSNGCSNSWSTHEVVADDSDPAQQQHCSGAWRRAGGMHIRGLALEHLHDSEGRHNWETESDSEGVRR